MKGIVFNLFERFVDEKLGPEAFEAIVDATDLVTKEPFVGPGNYPDADLFALVATTCRLHGITLVDALRAFGRFAFDHLAKTVPDLVSCHAHPKPFLMSLGSIIHVEVKKLYPSARPPEIESIDLGPGKMRLVYASPRCLGELAYGLLEGARDHFGAPFTIDVAERTTDRRWTLELAFAAEQDAA